MTVKEREDLECFIDESFADGRVSRELRLSRTEIDYIKGLYPRLSVKEIPKGIYDDEKVWVEVRMDKAN